MASSVKKRTKEGKASKSKRKRKPSVSDDENPAFLSSKYAEPPTSKIYNSHFRNNTPAELFRKDLISAMKLADNEPLCSEDYWLIEDSWKPEWEKGVQVPVEPESLPEPTLRILRKRKKDPKFKFPKKMIRFTRDSFFSPDIHTISYTAALAERTGRYDMDNVDVQWLSMVNEDREDFGLQPIDELLVENIMEELEEQCYDSFQEAIRGESGLGMESDEDAICDVCRSPDSEEGNEIVFCDACNICVHQSCYGITKIPEGSWICRTCAIGVRPSCILCPNRGGAMKTTRSGQKWCHVSCAIWMPEVSIGCVEKMEPITKISQIPAYRWSLVCMICKKKLGACIQCASKACKASYHVTCAFKQGLRMKAIMGDDDDDDALKLKSYCLKHSKRKLISSSDSDCEEMNRGIDDAKTEMEMTCEEKSNIREQKIHEREAQFYNNVSVDEIAELCQCDKDVIELIFNYWKLKRKANFNRPLLPPKAVTVDNNFLEENCTYTFVKRLVHLRQDLERVRNLCYMVSKREKMAKSWAKSKKEIFMKQADILDKEVGNLSKEQHEAVLMANHGDLGYDKKHTGLKGPSPNTLNVLNRLIGEEYAKTHLNGILKTNKKNEAAQSKKTPNPYAKHYLNGLLKRSQRWLATVNRQKRENVYFIGDSGSSNTKEKMDRHSSFASTSDHFTSDDCFDFSKESDNLDVSKSSAASHSYCFSTPDHKHLQSADRPSTSCIKSSTVKSLFSSPIDGFDSSNADIKPIVNPVESPNRDSKCSNFKLTETMNSSDASSLSKSCMSSKIEEVSMNLEISSIDSEHKMIVSNVPINEQSKKDFIPAPVTQNYSALKGRLKKNAEEDDTGNKICNNDNETETEKTIRVISFKKDPSDVDTSESSEAKIKLDKMKSHNHKANWYKRKRMKYVENRYKKNSHEKTKIDVNTVLKEDNDFINKEHKSSCDFKNNEVNDSSVDGRNISVEQDINEDKNSLDSTAEMSNSTEERELSEKNCEVKEKIILEQELRLEIEPCEFLSDTTSSNDGKKIVNSVIELNVENRDPFEADKTIVSKSTKNIKCSAEKVKEKTPVSSAKCNKVEKEKNSLPNSPLVNKISSPRTLSPSTKSTENENTKCDQEKVKFSSLPKTNSPGKYSSDTKIVANTQKHKSLYSSVHRSPSSVNKHRTMSPSERRPEKISSSSKYQNQEISECDKLKVKETIPKTKESVFPEAALPRKGSLSGYKIPKKVKTDVSDESSLERKRGSSPLSPLPDLTSGSTGTNSYQIRAKPSWKVGNHVLHRKPSPLVNGEVESQRLVIKLKKDPSDSHLWKADSIPGDRGKLTGWRGDFQSVPSNLHHGYHSPDARHWNRMRGNCERRPVHVPYGPGPPLT